MPKILVIDDDPVYLEMMVEVLRDEGHETIEAQNGLDGINMARAHKPDLIVSDVVMEKANGYAVLESLKKDATTASIPFILITGWSSKGGQRQGMAMGADDYLSKPFNATELIDTVTAQLKKKKQILSGVEQQLTQLKVSMTAAVPNELQKPLKTVLGFASMLYNQHQQLQAQQVAEIAQHIYTAGFALQTWVENFTIYLQLEQLALEPERTTQLQNGRTPQTEILIQERAMQKATSLNRSGDVQFKLASGSAAMAPEYFTKLFDVLLDNAFTFSETGTPVQIMTAVRQGRFGLSITDRGRGMTPEQVADIGAFAQFGKAEYEQSGLGLGLTIAKRIVELHGGVVNIKSVPGKGTRVTVEIKQDQA